MAHFSALIASMQLVKHHTSGSLLVREGEKEGKYCAMQFIRKAVSSGKDCSGASKARQQLTPRPVSPSWPCFSFSGPLFSQYLIPIAHCLCLFLLLLHLLHFVYKRNCLLTRSTFDWLLIYATGAQEAPQTLFTATQLVTSVLIISRLI